MTRTAATTMLMIHRIQSMPRVASTPSAAVATDIGAFAGVDPDQAADVVRDLEMPEPPPVRQLPFRIDRRWRPSR